MDYDGAKDGKEDILLNNKTDSNEKMQILYLTI